MKSQNKGMTRFCALSAVFLLTGLSASVCRSAGFEMSSVENSVAGIRVGDTLSKARRVFPDLKREEGGASVSVGKNCALGLTFDTADSSVDPRIIIVLLKRVDHNDRTDDPMCDSIATGAGLRFGENAAAIQRIYKGIPFRGVSTENRQPFWVYGGQRGKECLNRKSSVLRYMLIYWSEDVRRLMRIELGADRSACQDYRDGYKDAKGLERR